MQSFRPGLWPTLTVMVGVPVLLVLGTWQVQRLDWKTDLIETLQRRAAETPIALPPSADLGPALSHRRVTVTGVMRAEPALRYGVSRLHGAPGHRVLQALTVADGRTVVVDRGWVRADVARPSTPRGEVSLTGALSWIGDERRRWPVPANDPIANRWYWYDLAAFDDAFATDVEPIVLILETATLPAGDAVPVPQPAAVDLPNNHLGYALTWYGLALVLLIIYGAYGRQRGEELGS